MIIDTDKIVDSMFTGYLAEVYKDMEHEKLIELLNSIWELKHKAICSALYPLNILGLDLHCSPILGTEIGDVLFKKVSGRQ